MHKISCIFKKGRKKKIIYISKEKLSFTSLLSSIHLPIHYILHLNITSMQLKYEKDENIKCSPFHFLLFVAQYLKYTHSSALFTSIMRNFLHLFFRFEFCYKTFIIRAYSSLRAAFGSSEKGKVGFG